jgi:ATPase subunit of ABC transporter with duplicated ATPase domains
VSIDRGVTIGYFRQDVGDMSGRTVIEETMNGAGPVAEVASELKKLELAMGDPEQMDKMDQLVERFGEVQARFDELGGYALEGKAREILAGLGFRESMVDGDVGALSGGWKMRVALARILLMEPDAMMLDEPTNHLDLESIAALAEGLQRYEGTVIVVTHDQELLSEVATRIWAPRRGKEVIDFVGGFDDFLVKHADAAAQRR